MCVIRTSKVKVFALTEIVIDRAAIEHYYIFT